MIEMLNMGIIKNKKGKNFEDIQENNRSLVIQILSKHKTCTRVEIARETGLQQATITNIVAALINLGVVKEVGFVEGRKGRRSRAIKLNADRYKIIAVKIERHSFQVGLFSIIGKDFEIYSESIDVEAGPVFAIKKLKEAISNLLEKNKDIFAIGVAVPGPYLRYKGKIAIMTEFPGWEGINLNEEFTSAFDIPVYIEHDANAAALAEWGYGGYNLEKGTLVHFLASEGIGAGIVNDGKNFTGSQGIAGEIGHMSINVDGEKCACGNHGCLELYCSSIAIVKKSYGELINYPDSCLNEYLSIKIEDIFDGFEKKDALCVELVRSVSRYIGYGIVNIVNLYNPSVIVISGVMSSGGQFTLDIINMIVKDRVLKEMYENLSIKISSFAIDPILYGAVALAADNLLNRSYIICRDKEKI